MTSNTVHVQRETFKQLAGEQCKVICGHEPVNIHTYSRYYSQSFVDLDTQCVWKCLVHVCVATGVATGGLCRPAHLNSTEIKVNSFFSWDVVRGGGGWGGGGGGVGGGGGGGGGGCVLGFQRGGVMWVQGSHSLGEKAV